MAMFFEQRKRRKRKHPEEGIPGERFSTEEDIKALATARKIEKDPNRYAKVKALAKEKLDERKRRGKDQAMVNRKDNTASIPKHNIDQEQIDQWGTEWKDSAGEMRSPMEQAGLKDAGVKGEMETLAERLISGLKEREEDEKKKKLRFKKKGKPDPEQFLR